MSSPTPPSPSPSRRRRGRRLSPLCSASAPRPSRRRACWSWDAPRELEGGEVGLVDADILDRQRGDACLAVGESVPARTVSFASPNMLTYAVLLATGTAAYANAPAWVVPAAAAALT